MIRTVAACNKKLFLIIVDLGDFCAALTARNTNLAILNYLNGTFFS